MTLESPTRLSNGILIKIGKFYCYHYLQFVFGTKESIFALSLSLSLFQLCRPTHKRIAIEVLDCQTLEVRGAFINIQIFFFQAFKIVVDSWKFSILLLYILWDDWPIFMISHSNEHLQQQLEFTLLKTDCHSWWISQMQPGREDTLEERYAIKFCFKLGKNAAETYGMLQTAFRPSCINRASVFEWHKRFKEGRESVREDKCGKSKKVNTPELIGQTVRVTMLRF